MQDYQVERDYDKDIKFRGMILAGVDNARRDTLRLYLSDAGNYVCERRLLNYKGPFRDELGPFKREGAVCKTYEDVKEFFQYNSLAKKLYDQAGIKHWITA
jgi:hypothetical protein